MIALVQQHQKPPSGTGARRKLAATMLVTCTLMVAEAIGGWISGSLALMADAGHMLTDFLALGVAFAAISLSRRPANERATYGYRRVEILGALVNGIALVVVSGSIAYEAVQRWFAPREIDFALMAGVAAIGLVANLIGLWLLRGHGQNLNLRGAFLHVLGDTLTSVGVLVGAGLIALTGWMRIDALISIGIACVIVVTSLILLREVLNVLLEAAPPGIDTEEVRRTIGGVRGVDQVHDLHVWSITSGLPALSAHVVVSDPSSDPQTVLSNIQSLLRSKFEIDHSTLQIEPRALDDCGCC